MHRIGSALSREEREDIKARKAWKKAHRELREYLDAALKMPPPEPRQAPAKPTVTLEPRPKGQWYEALNRGLNEIANPNLFPSE